MDELSLARELADIADEIAIRYFYYSRDKATREKSDGTLVTAADTEIETALRKRIREEFPDHAILGEEDGLDGPEGAPVWVLDPIDGTNNFAWGIPIFATLIALRVDGSTVLGLASAPALGERYEAARGEGATMNGDPIEVSRVSSIEESRILYASLKGMQEAGVADPWKGLLARCKRERGFGDFWGHMLVARGAADVMAEPSLSIWDVAALEVIIEEAGGRCTGFDGTAFPDFDSGRGPSSLVTTNGLLHGEVLGALNPS